ncbi:MAG: hypothetical protein ACI3YS_05555, partial [Prevotella sp.]
YLYVPICLWFKSVCKNKQYFSFMQVFRLFLPEMAHGSSDHRNLDGIYTDVLGVAYGKKSLEEILFKMLPTARNILGR